MEIELLQELFFNELINLNSPLTDFSQGSITYTLSRAAAVLAFDQFIQLDRIEKNFYINTASGDYLDRYGEFFDIKRKEGTTAKGYVLASNRGNSITLPTGTVITSIDTTLQYVTTQSATLVAFIDTKIPVTALAQGDSYNLEEGKVLFSSIFPDVSFVVGAHRTSSGKLCGYITNGSSLESDAGYRERLIAAINAPRFTSVSSLLTLLNKFPFVSGGQIQTILPGSFIVWVDSDKTLSSSQLGDLNYVFNLNKPAGVLCEVRQAIRIVQDFELKVLVSSGADYNKLFEQIKTRFVRLISSNLVGVEVNPQVLASQVARELNTQVIVSKPQSIIKLGLGEIIYAGGINIITNV